MRTRAGRRSNPFQLPKILRLARELPKAPTALPLSTKARVCSHLTDPLAPQSEPKRDLPNFRPETGEPRPLLAFPPPTMMVAMPNLLDRITVNPDQCGGRPCVRGMRIRVIDVLDLLSNGLTAEQVLEELPDLEPEDIQACLAYASRRLDHPVLGA